MWTTENRPRYNRDMLRYPSDLTTPPVTRRSCSNNIASLRGSVRVSDGQVDIHPLERKLRTLTGGDMAKPIVAVGFNVAQFDGYNLALRIRHAGYTNVYWYRGGREAWEVAGKPEGVMRPADW
jgi:hypothetical protein